MAQIKEGTYKCGYCSLDIHKNIDGITLTVDDSHSFFFEKDGSFDGFGILSPNAKELEEFEKYINNNKLEATCPHCDFVYDLGKKQIPFTTYKCPNCKELYVYEYDEVK